MADATVILLTYNGEKYLEETLEMLFRQIPPPAEVIAIDSGSIDRTIEILERHRVKTEIIPNTQFSHPGTRNRAVALAKCQHLVFLTQDATPADSCWLRCLLEPFHRFPNVAGSFSRQVARPDSDLLEANDLDIYFKKERWIKTMPADSQEYKKHIWHYIQFSNASAAYDRELLLQNPFDEGLEMAEDQEWAKRMLEKGYSIVYEPASLVLHSHNYSMRQKYSRNLSMGRSFSRFLSPQLGRRRFPLGAWTVHVLLDIRYLLRSRQPLKAKLKTVFHSPLHRAAMHLAYYKGWNSQFGAPCQVIEAKPQAQSMKT